MTKGIGSVAWARATHSVRADGRRLSAHAPQAHIGDPVSKRLSRLPLAPVFQPPWVSANVLAYRFQLFLVSDDAIVVISMPELSLIPGPPSSTTPRLQAAATWFLNEPITNPTVWRADSSGFVPVTMIPWKGTAMTTQLSERLCGNRTGRLSQTTGTHRPWGETLIRAPAIHPR